MGVAATSTEATMSAIQDRLVEINLMLSHIAARQEEMLVDLKKTTAALTPTTTTMPTFVPDRVLEQQTTKPSSALHFSANQVIGAGAPQMNTTFASTTPTRRSTLCSTVNVRYNHAVDVFPTSGIAHLPAKASISTRNNTLQGVVGSSANTSAGCLAHVLSCPLEDPDTRALKIDTDKSDEMLTLVGGLSLFIQLEWDSTKEIFNGNYLKGSVWDEGIPDEVLTHVGGLSLFKELDLDAHMEFEESTVKFGEAVDLIWVTPSQWNMVFSVTPPCGQNALATGKPELEGAHGLFDKTPSWENSAFHPGNFVARGDHLSLNKIPSWQRSAFSPGNSEIGGADYVFVQTPPWGTNVIQPRFFATQGNCLVLGQKPPWGRSDFSLEKVGMVREQSWTCDSFYPWRRNSFSPGNNEQHGMMYVFHYDDTPIYVLNLLARIIRAQLFAQWDSGKKVGRWLMLSQYFKEYVQSILGREVCATTSNNDHLLDVTTFSKESSQHGFCLSDSIVDVKVDAKQFGVYNIFWTIDATTKHWDPGILRFICQTTLQHLILIFSYRAYGVSVEDGLISDLEIERENMSIILFDVHTMVSLVWLSQVQQLLYMCCGFFSWRQVRCKLQFKQWDPGVF